MVVTCNFDMSHVLRLQMGGKQISDFSFAFPVRTPSQASALVLLVELLTSLSRWTQIII